jgi:CheY-like chemotaxis protein
MDISMKLASKDAGAAKGKSPAIEKEALVRDGTAPASQCQPATSVGRDRKILIVDDNPVVLKAFELKLKASGFSVTTTENGAAVARTASQTAPELIILDINFPSGGSMEWTGFTIMQWIRRFPNLAKIPIIMITGADAREHQDKARAAGAVALFQKPVNYQQLLPVILQALGDCGAAVS